MLNPVKSWQNIFTSRPLSKRRVIYFLLVSGIGVIANLLAVELPFILPFLIGNVAVVTLQIRLGFKWSILALFLVLLPVEQAFYWGISLAQLVSVMLFSPNKPGQSLKALLLFLLCCCMFFLTIAPAELVGSNYAIFSHLLLLTLLFYLIMRASLVLIALSMSVNEQKTQQLKEQLAGRVAMYSAIPTSLFIALTLHSAIVMDVSSHLSHYSLEQKQLDANLTALLDDYQARAQLSANLLAADAEVDTAVLLKTLTHSKPEFISALITDQAGDVISFYKADVLEKELAGLNVSSRQYFYQAKAVNRSTVSDTFQGRTLGQDQLIAVSAPIIKHQQFQGILQMSVLLDALHNTLSVEQQPYIQRLLIDKNHYLVWGQTDSFVPGQFINTETGSISTGPQYMGYSPFNNYGPIFFTEDRQQLMLKMQNDRTGWMLLVKLDPEYLVKKYQLMLLIAMLTAIFMLECITFAARRFVHRYTASLEILAQYAQSWREDTNTVLPAPVLQQSSTEFEALLSTLTQLQCRVQQAYAQISQALHDKNQLNEELEQRVLQRTDELAKERDNAKELASVKSRFLANMSHEIRTPITIIKGFLEELELQTGLAPNERKEILNRLRRNTVHLQHVVDDILDSAKIDEGKLRLESDFFNLQAFIIELSESFTPLANQKRLSIICHYHVDKNSQLFADPFRLRQILSNLLSNSIKFTTAGAIELTVSLAKNKLFIQISDKGIGISKAQLSALFSPFNQADSSISRRYGGTGLGLYISQQLAKMMSFELKATSQIEHGSTFSLIIPPHLFKVTADTAAQHMTIPAIVQQHLSGKVLIVDDVADMRNLLCRMLAKTGLTLVEATNGAEAVTIATTNEFDLIIMDQQMPILDGISAAKQIRAHGYAGIIISLSADVYNTSVSIPDSPFDDVLAKPVERLELNAVLQKYLRRAPQQALLAEQDDDLADLRLEYKQHLVKQCTALSQLYQLNNQSELIAELHKIKGTSGSFGLMAVSQTADECLQRLKQQLCCTQQFQQLLNLINT